MKKSVIILLGLACAATFAACSDGDKKTESSSSESAVVENIVETVDVEFGQDVSLLGYFGEGDTLIDARLRDPDGKQIPLKNGVVNFQTIGRYTLVFADGDAYVLDVKDTKGPSISRQTVEQYYYVGTEYDLGLVCLDAKDGEVTPQTVSVTYGKTEESAGASVAVTNGKFTPNAEGDYEVYCKAVDAAGNSSEKTFTITARNYYEPALKQKFAIETLHGAAVREDFAVVGDKRYEITKGTGDTIASIRLEGDVDDKGQSLKAYTVYSVTVDYRVDNYVPIESQANLRANTPFEVYLSQAWEPYITCAPGEGSFTFEVTTNEEGCYLWKYSSMKLWGEMDITWLGFEFTEVETLTPIHEYTFGNHTLRLDKSPDRTNFVNVERTTADGRKYFETRLLEFKEGGYEYLTISGKNLTPNKTYTFVIDYDWEFSASANFAFYILYDGNLAVDVAKGLKTETSIEYRVTTDKKGEYSIQYKHLCVAEMCRLKWMDVRDKEDYYGNFVRAEAGESVALDLDTLGVSFPKAIQTNTLAYSVEKVTVEVDGTASRQALPAGTTSVTVEDGYFYDVTVTAKGTDGSDLSAHVNVYEASALVLGSEKDNELKMVNRGYHYAKLNSLENGNVVHQVENHTGNPIVNLGVSMTVAGAANGVYKVYADVTHPNGVNSSNWLLQMERETGGWITADGRYLLATVTLQNGQTVFSDGTLKDGVCFNFEALMDRGTDGKAYIDNVVLVPQYIKTDVASIGQPVGKEIELNGRTNNFGLEFYESVLSVDYAVNKTVGVSTTMETTAVDMSTGKFTVETGCFYDVNMTITTVDGKTLKKHVCVHDEGIVVLSGGDSGVYCNVTGRAISRLVTDEYGKVSYQIDSSVASFGTQEWGAATGVSFRAYDGGMVSGKTYQMYCDVVHSWDASQGDSWVFQKQNSGTAYEQYITTQESRRCFGMVNISAANPVINVTTFYAARLGNLTGDRTITVRNVVLVAQD